MTIRLLVLDLDETLVHASDVVKECKPDFEFYDYFIFKRPHLDTFIKYCLKNFDVGIWSSAGDEYVSFIAKQLFIDTNNLKFVWSSKNCINKSTGVNFIKDLRKLRRFGYLTHEIIIVDDSPEKVCRQPKNLIKIAPFFGNQNDVEFFEIISKIEERKIGLNI